MQALPGFREFYPADCARREYLLAAWRAVAIRYGFGEVDGPTLEPVDLYVKKSGGELVGQLFAFTDQGGRQVALRPELTPTVARMIAARHRDFRKPLKWFGIGPFFRYEKQQRGRLREFLQFNCDIVGDPSAAADAELIALAIDTLRELGFGPDDVRVRISDRRAWADWGAARGLGAAELAAALEVIDKLDRLPEADAAAKLARFNVGLDEVRAFLAGPPAAVAGLGEVLADLAARGLGEFVTADLGVVRGLAYYTGVVFEVFDRRRAERAVAGGGRYDGLLALMSDGKTDLPAVGFGMGDVVLGNLVDDTPAAAAAWAAWLAGRRGLDVYVVLAQEARRPAALGLVQRLRDGGYRVDYPLAAAKVGKQFQAAEQLGAKVAVVVGDEWPQVKIKDLAAREEILAGPAELDHHLARLVRTPAGGPAG